MHTLFSENILSPSPAVAPQHNPFELSFYSSVSNASSSVSAQSSPQQHDLLTRYYQNQQRIESETAIKATNVQRAQYGRRKGNPKVLFVGLRKGGKSSIQKVVFQKLSPADTLFLEPTTTIQSTSMQSFVTFESAEIPTAITLTIAENEHHPTILANVGAVIWVIDVQDELFPSITELINLTVFLAEHYPRINVEVFIHKTDGLSDEYKYDTYREVRQRVQDELSDMGHGDRSVSYYQTSVFDHSIFEAMSKVVQKLLPQLPAMEALLNKLCSTCRIQKAYLFDTVSKVYIAADASPSFLRDYEVCSDYVDVIIDIKQIYGWQSHHRRKEDGGEEGMGESMITYDRSGDTYIYAREINEYLSLICVMGKGSSADKRMLIDYNVGVLTDALLQVFNR